VSHQLKLEIVYNHDLISSRRVNEFLNQFELLLDQITRDPEKNILGKQKQNPTRDSHSLLEYPLVTTEAKKILPNPRDPLNGDWLGSIQSYLTKQAQKQGEKPAIVYQDTVTSYASLEKWTNQLAHYIHNAGVRPKDVIGIYGHRSTAVVIVIMGILKAGCAYTMMDPAYPFERIKKCLEIAAPKGWIAIKDAGDPPEELSQFLQNLGLPLNIVLPQPNIAEEIELLEVILGPRYCYSYFFFLLF